MKIFSGSQCPKNILFHFGNGSTASSAIVSCRRFGRHRVHRHGRVRVTAVRHADLSVHHDDGHPLDGLLRGGPQASAPLSYPCHDPYLDPGHALRAVRLTVDDPCRSYCLHVVCDCRLHLAAVKRALVRIPTARFGNPGLGA